LSTTINSLIISKESLALFENNLVLAKNVDWSYSDKFGQENGKIGATYKIRRPVLPTVIKNNLAWNAASSAVTETFVTLTIDRTVNSPISFNDQDMALRIERFSDRYIKPSVAVLASTVDSSIADSVVNSAVGTAALQGASDPGTVGPNAGGYMITYAVAADVNLVNAITLARKVLQDQACPDSDDIYGVLSTAAHAVLVRAQMTLFNPLTQVGDKYRKGMIGTFDGIQFSYSQNLVAHTNGSVNTVAVTAGELTTGWAETSSVTITNTTGIQPGDVYEVTGAYIVNPLTKAVTDSAFQFQVVSITNGTTMVVSPAIITAGQYQNVSATIVGKTTTLKGGVSTTAVESLVFHKSAIAVAAVEMATPKKSSEDMIETIKPEDGEGFKFRFIRSYDTFGTTSTFGAGVPGFLSRFDGMYGVKTVLPAWIVRLRPV
jgi:hypothetical protein